MKPPTTKIIRLEPFGLIADRLHGLDIVDGDLIASIGEASIALPIEMESGLSRLIGLNVILLRTDIEEKQYLFRVFDRDPEDEGREIHYVDGAHGLDNSAPQSTWQRLEKPATGVT